jgi:[ribosomal protein S5]-alanine N-acetyltransferase
VNKYQYATNLESQRLRTSFLTKEHVTWWSEFFTTAPTVEFMQMFLKPTHAESAAFWIDSQLLRYSENRYGMQVLTDKKTNEKVGQCGLLLQEVDGIKELEVGYHVLHKHWGKGYAPEAAKMFIDYAFKNNLSESVISIIDIRNLRSQRVADKNGLKREKQTRWRDMDVFVYRIKKSKN